MDLALNNLQRLICHKTKPTNHPLFPQWHLYYSSRNGLRLTREKEISSLNGAHRISLHVSLVSEDGSSSEVFLYQDSFSLSQLFGFSYFIYSIQESNVIFKPEYMEEYPLGVMVKPINCRIVVSEFELKSHYYVHFQNNTVGKGMNPFILPDMGQVVP